MTASKSLPHRPSLESLRKQAKKLARDAAAGDAAAIARAQVHLPNAAMPLTQRNAQLVIAREYGYAGWQDLTAEVSKRVGKGLEWAVAQAQRIIHDNDVEGLKQLLAEYPALLSWQSDDNQRGLMNMATGAFGDSFDPNRERMFTRQACAELLIDAGAIVMPSVYEEIIQSRARGLLELFQHKGLLPRTLEFLAARGDIDAVRASLAADESGNDASLVNEAFLCACRFQHEAVASLLLERSLALDADLKTQVERFGGRSAFTKYLIENGSQYIAHGLQRMLLMHQLARAIAEGDLMAFVSGLQRDPWLLGEAAVELQVDLVQRATMRDRGEFIVALLDLDPALARRQPPPESQVFEFALTYARTHLVPILTRVWPLPDDLPHAAGTGNLPQVMRWFDESGAPALGDLDRHFPCNDPRTRGHLHWNPPTVQHVLDTALAYAVINRHFEVADYLLDHGADVNTNWGSHEPASILHELVGQVGTGENPGNYESMQFLIDRGIDLTIEDYRWQSTAQGWARYAANDEKMAQWLADAQRQREQGAR